ncbi:MAG: molecular chaperone TorD family protein [Betaproteobacteria bacterium]
MATAQITLLQRIEPEDESRAQFYALLARLFANGPDAQLLAALGRSEPWTGTPDNPLASTWNMLILASSAMDQAAAEQEYTEIFVGVGKAECNLHASYWVREATSMRPLVAVRADLKELGLARQGGSTVYEDHLSALCETMRFLIEGDRDRAPSTIDVQRAFFSRHIASWIFECCNAICECPLANYYRRVAEFTRLFMAVERDSLAI